ncbi:MAG: hypothetical protein QOC94_396 [Actinoplanes sp.]|nr:hypothetical protein [Actinoplanes sp.]
MTSYRLSPPQRYVWSQVAAPSIQCRVRPASDVTPEALARALATVVARHESLRSYLVPVAGLATPLQSVAEPDAPPPAEEPPVRAELLEDSVVVLAASSLFVDRRSLLVIAAELTALLAGDELPEVELQYLDAAEWLSEQAEGADAKARMERWRQRELPAAAALSLPLDESPGPRATPGPEVEATVDGDGLPAVPAVAAELGVSVAAVVLAATHLLLWRLTGADEIVTGVVCTTPGLDELADVVGPIELPVPVRTAFEPELRFDAVVRDLDRALTTAPAEQFSLDVTGDSVDLPVSFAATVLPAGHIERLDGARAGGLLHVDLVQSVSGEPAVRIVGDPSRLGPAQVRRLARQLDSVLRAVAAAPGSALGDLGLADDDEATRLVTLGIGATPPIQGPELVHAAFEAHAGARPDAPAVSCAGEHLSYGAVERRANQLAHALVARDVRGGTPVALLLERSVDYAVALLAVLKTGGCFVPVDPALPDARVQTLLREVGAPVVISHRSLSGAVAAEAFAVLDLDDDEVLAGQPTTAPAVTVTPDDVAYIIFTSGSTGRPKGVAVPHRAVRGYVDAVTGLFELGPDARLASLATPAADLGHTAVFGALCTGRSLLLGAPDEILDAGALARRFRETPVNALKITPSHLAALLEGPDAAGVLPTECLVLGGEQTTPPLLSRIRKLRPDLRIFNHYGPTETTVGAVCTEVTSATDVVPIGTALPGYRTYVLDADRRPVLEGAPGELYIGGRSVANGYWRNEDATAERFLPDPFDPGARMYRTGDLVRMRPSGDLVFLGRADDQTKIRGHRVELGEIAAALRGLDGVSDAAVVTHPDGDDRYVVAYVVPQRAAGVTAEDLRGRLSRQLPDYLVPRAVVLLAALPLTANGKVNRAALPPVDQAHARGATRVAPRTATESTLAQIWGEVLGTAEVGVDEDFFQSLGGNSLAATRVVARIQAATGVTLPVSALFNAPTIAGLAAAVDAATPDDTGPIPLIDRRVPLELSYAQRRIWVLSEVDGPTAAYNIPAAIRLTGPIDADALARALGAVVDRHESLRTNVVPTDGAPVQVIRPPAGFALPVLDAAEDQVQELAAEFGSRPFDLARDELFRATLLRIADDRHVLLLCLHHIVSDGWSTALLWQEVLAHYGASPLPPLQVQYADFAAWQNAWLRGEGVRPQLEYWREQLRGLPALLELPTDRPRPAAQTASGATLPVALDPELVRSLHALAGRSGSTVFMVLLAAFTALMSRYSGQRNIAVGTPFANRTRPEVQDLIGCFFNTLVIRSDLSADPSFTELLAQVRSATLAAQENQDLPFERLVEELNPPRDTGHSPLFQVLFVHQPAPATGPDLAGVQVEQLPLAGTVAKYDLTLDLVETGDAVAGRLEYRTDLFDQATVARLAEHFQVLLESIVADPARPVGELDLMRDAERERLLSEFNSPYTEMVATPLLADAFEEWAARHPDRTALVSGRTVLTYAQLDLAAARLAGGLRDAGLTGNQLVGIWLDRSVEMVVAILAVLKAGGAYVPLDPDLPVARVGFVAQDAGIRLIIADPARADDLPADVTLIDPQGYASGDVVAWSRDGRPEDLAYVMYTSGSTGTPKGVMITQRNLASFFHAMDERLGGGSDPGTWLALTHYTFDISVLELLWTLTRGAKVVLAGAELVLDPVEAAAPGRAVDFSLFYFASDGGDRSADKYKLLLDAARWADQHDFCAVWTPERHFGTFGGLYPNPTVTAAALATATTRIGIRTGSLVLPLHDPIRVAEDWAVIDNLSGGRVGMSFAPGWQPNDFVLAPDRYARRREILVEHLDTVRRLWRGESVWARSGTGDDVEVRTLPRPLQDELPVWLTTAGNHETYRKAGALGANVLTHLLGQTEEELAAAIAVYRDAWRAAGHPGEGYVTLMLHTFVGADPDVVRAAVRAPLTNYLRESTELIRPIAAARGLELADLDEADLDTLLDHAFERYYRTSGMFGTPDRCMAMARRLGAAGVDEIACLIDFGVGTDEVLASLPLLDEVRRRTAADPEEEPPTDVAGLIRHHDVTHLQCTPTVAGLLASHADTLAALGALEHMLVGGEALPTGLAELLATSVAGTVLNMYGPTEATIWSTSDHVVGNDVSIGRPLSNTRVYVLDDKLRPTPVGVPGELCIAGDGVARGYLGRPELTAERFVPDRYGNDLERTMYRTGDVARYRSDGALQFIGRADDQIKINGLRVELGEIETAIRQVDGVRSCAVIATDDGHGGRRLVAYLVSSQPVDQAAVRQQLESFLPRYMVPGVFVTLPALPLLPSGKVNRKALPAPGPDEQAAAGFLPPVTDTEKALADIWSTLLRVPRVGLDDNFFHLGGDSIIAIQMVSRARRSGISVSARHVFGHQTLAALARVVRTETPVAAPEGAVTGDSPLTPIQHWLFAQELTDVHHYNQALVLDVPGRRLDTARLTAALRVLVEHHDALRNQFSQEDGRWRQWTNDPADVSVTVEVLELGDRPADEWADAVAAAKEMAQSSFDLGRAPLVRAVHLRYDGVTRPDQLFIAIHHTVVDGLSWRILAEDLELAYEALEAGRQPVLPPRTTSYQRWAGRLTEAAIAADTTAELAYWQAQLAPTKPLPRDLDGANTEATTRTVTVQLPVEQTTALLRDLPLRQRVETREALLYALAGAFTAWTGSTTLLVDVEGHGREDVFPDVDVSRTVGWLTSMYPVRLSLPGGTGAGDLMAVKEQVRAVPRRGIGFGLLRYLHPDDEVRDRLAGGARAEVVFNYLGQADAGQVPETMFAMSAESTGAPHAPSQRRHHLVNVNAIVLDGRLSASFTYSTAVHAESTMEALADRFRDSLAACLDADLPLSPADFPDAALSQGEFDELMAELGEVE